MTKANRYSFLFFLVLLFPFCAARGEVKADRLQVTLSALKVKQGSLLLVKWKPTEKLETSKGLSVKWNGSTSALFQSPVDSENYMAVFAIPYDASIGTQQLTVSADSGEERAYPFQITSGGFHSEKLKVDPSKIKLSPKDEERVRLETEEVRAIYGAPESGPVWVGKFSLPVKGMVRSQYGTKRVFNGQTKGHHNGVDLRAATGTPVHAANAGRVCIAKDFFYGGNLVILDHGAGVFTIYGHMSRIDVKVGDKVTANQVLGLSGATGRVNGPHVHWGVRVHGVEANPLELLTLTANR